MTMRLGFVHLLLILSLASAAQSQPDPATHSLAAAVPASPDLVLAGDISGAQNKTYFEIPFDVPPGKHRINVDFSYTAKEQRAVLDLGIADPERFRGASGGNKSHFTISETDATPSYLPGAIMPGRWRLLISVPNMRPQAVSHYTAEIRFDARGEETGFADRLLAIGKRWYRGDLHMHTAHSDGSCLSQSGREVPCPLFLTVQTAASRALDFIAITDHNTDSQYDEMRELQPFFDHLLLIPGREVTTFHGHFNVFGVTQFIDWRVSPGRLSLNDVMHDVLAKGGIASVSHAEAPEGEDCMGCRWMPSADADMGLFSAVEVINYGRVMFSSAKYWDGQLREGHRLAAIGGSDNHNATTPPGEAGSIGWPTTVVEANELSVPAILSGIRTGRTFIDLTASRDKVLDFDAEANGITAKMGETLHVVDGARIRVTIHVNAAQGSTTHLLLDGEESSANPSMPLDSANAILTTTLTTGSGRHWLRVEVRDKAGKSELIGSPIYINFPEN
jgi:hypothetical protein